MSAVERYKDAMDTHPPMTGAPLAPALQFGQGSLPKLLFLVISELIERVERLEESS